MKYGRFLLKRKRPLIIKRKAIMKKILFWGLLALVMAGQAGAVKQLVVVRYSQKEELKNILSNSRLDVLENKTRLRSGMPGR